jgi:hypothetical protein
MKNNNIYIHDFCLIIFLILVMAACGILNLLYFLPLFIVLLAIILIFLKKKEMVFILFLVSLTTNNLIPKENFFLGFIGVQQVLGFISFFLLINKKRTIINSNKRALSIINNLLFFIVLYVVYTTFKNVYFGIFGTNFFIAITRVINFPFLIYVSYLIINKTINNRIIAFRASIAAMIFLGITSVFSSFFIALGYYISINGEKMDRYNGFTGNGDANTLALIMVIGFAMILNKILLDGWKKIYMIPSAISIITIGLTGSRSGLVLLIFSVIIYFLSQKNIKKVFNGLFIFLIITLLSLPLLETNLDRLVVAKDEQSQTEGTSNRVGKWLFYTDYFSKNPDSILFGADKELEVSWNGKFIVAHNIYIQILYNSGILFLIYYISLLYKSKVRRKYFHGNIYMMLIPLIIGTSFISDYGAIPFYLFSIVPFIKHKSINLKKY